MKEEEKQSNDEILNSEYCGVNFKKLEDTRRALINMLEDFEEARRLAEDQKERTESIIENFSDGIILLKKDKEISFINPQAEKFFNLDNEVIAGKNIDELSTINAFVDLNKILESNEKIFRKELKIEERFILEVSTISINEKDGGILIILHDVTREKRVEKMKTDFVTVTAHQLRTPLSAIKWTIKMLSDGDAGVLNQEQKEFLNKIYISNERLINLMNDLLNITRIEEGRYLHKPSSINFVKEVESVLDFYKDIIKKKGVEVSLIKPEKELPEIFLDVEKIRLSIQNLLDNAIKYTPSGKKIRIIISRKANDIIFEISDEGIGIPVEDRENIFSKFFRGNKAMKEDTEGSGLGLFITKNIIEAHKGKIWFEPRKSEGTTFYFSLPINNK